MAQRGRPPKYKERLIPRHFALPVSLNEDLVSSCREAGVDQVKFVRQAIRDGLNKGADKVFGDPGESLKLPADVRNALVTAIHEEREKGGQGEKPPPSDGRQQYSFNLIEEDAKELEKLAGALYMDDPQLFVKILTRAALDAGPEAVKKLLYGQFDADVDAHVAAKEEAAKSKKTTRKAA